MEGHTTTMTNALTIGLGFHSAPTLPQAYQRLPLGMMKRMNNENQKTALKA